jgi:hypothetical protein
VRWSRNGEPRTIDPRALRSAAYRKVLALQKAAPIGTILEFDAQAREMAEDRKGPAPHVEALAKLAASLPAAALDKKTPVDREDRKILEEFAEDRMPALIARARQRAARRKTKPEELQKLRAELLAALNPHLHAALSGVIYAYFLSPDDLVVSEDPLLLRKHRYFEPWRPHELFLSSNVAQSSGGAGSHIVGGFAEFQVAAGQIAVAGAKNAAGSEMAAAQFGSLRATDWTRLTEADLYAAGLRTRLAREWILHAAADANLQVALAEETLGLLSPTRRSQLLEAVESRDWPGAFDAVTLGDQHELSARYLARFQSDSWKSPVVAALRRIPPGDNVRLRLLGPSAVELLGCSHPHLGAPGPYEQYERSMFPFQLAERAAEFKLFLAEAGVRAGIPPAALGAAAQELAAELLSKTSLTGIKDWRTVNAAYASLDEAAVEAAVEKRR